MSECSLAMEARIGLSCWHGPHHVAEKSTMLIVPGLAIKVVKSVAFKVCDEEVEAVLLTDFLEHELSIPSASNGINRRNFTIRN